MATMRLNLLAVLTSLLFASSAFAEDINWPTYYPSPYGAYTTLVTTGRTTLASAGGNVELAQGGMVGVGVANPTYVLDVRSMGTEGAGFHTAAFNNNAGYGVAIGGVTTAGAPPPFGSLQAFQIGGGGSGTLVLNPGGSRVGIGLGSDAAALNGYTLGIAGNGRIGFHRGGVVGEYMLSYGGDGNYYPVYAPG